MNIGKNIQRFLFVLALGITIPCLADNGETTRPGAPEQHTAIPWGAVLLLAAAIGFGGYLIAKRNGRISCQRLLRRLSSQIAILDANGRILFCKSEKDASIHFIYEWPGLEQYPLQKWMEQVLKTGQPVTAVYRHNGTCRQATFSKLPPGSEFANAAILMESVDQTRIDNICKQTESLAERLRLTLESIGDGVIVTDADGVIVIANKVAAQLIGCEKQEMPSHPFDDFVRLLDCRTGMPLESPIRQTLHAQQPVKVPDHAQLLSRQGVRYRIAASVSPMLECGTVTGTVMIFRDMTQDYEKRDHIEQQQLLLKSAAQDANIDFFVYHPLGQIVLDRNISGRLWGKDGKGRYLPPDQWVLPADLPGFLAQWEALLSGKSDKMSYFFRGGQCGIAAVF